MKLLNIFKRSTVKSRLKEALALTKDIIEINNKSRNSKECRPKEYYQLGVEIAKLTKLESVLTKILNG